MFHHNDGTVSLRPHGSTEYRNAGFMGILANGKVKLPSLTGTGDAGRFRLIRSQDSPPFSPADLNFTPSPEHRSVQAWYEMSLSMTDSTSSNSPMYCNSPQLGVGLLSSDPVLALPLTIHLMRCRHLGTSLTHEDITAAIIPLVNQIWSQAGIIWTPGIVEEAPLCSLDPTNELEAIAVKTRICGLIKGDRKAVRQCFEANLGAPRAE